MHSMTHISVAARSRLLTSPVYTAAGRRMPQSSTRLSVQPRAGSGFLEAFGYGLPQVENCTYI